MNKEDVNKRWAEHFKELLNIVDDSVRNISAVGIGMINVCRDLMLKIEFDEINEAVRILKGGKSPGIVEIAR